MTGKWFGFEWREVFDEAINLFERKDFEEATVAFEACRSEAEASVGVDKYLGKCYEVLAIESLAREEFSVAAANAENALGINSSFPDLHILAAKGYIGLDCLTLAQRHLQKALLLNPGYGEARELLGKMRGTSDDAATEDPHSEAVRDHVRYLLGVGDECLKQELCLEALAVFEKADQLIPNYPDVNYKIASAHIALGNMDAAELMLTRCLELKGSYPEALSKLGELRERRGEFASGERLIGRAKAMSLPSAYLA